MRFDPLHFAPTSRIWKFQTSLCWLLLAVLAAFAVDGRYVSAAGCNYPHRGSTKSSHDALAPFSSLVTIYEGGEFKVIVPIGGPCDGPSCRATPPNMTSQKLVIVDRIDGLDLSGFEKAPLRPRISTRRRNDREVSPFVQTIVLDGLLRPPSFERV
jgi:hypothetical protein